MRLLSQVDEKRNPRTTATVNQLMDRYLQFIDVDRTTRKGYESRIRNHIRPLLGRLPVARLDGETLDSFFTVLRTCRAHSTEPPRDTTATSAAARTSAARSPRP